MLFGELIYLDKSGSTIEEKHPVVTLKDSGSTGNCYKVNVTSLGEIHVKEAHGL